MDRYIALTKKLVDAYQGRNADILAHADVDQLRNEIRTPNGGRYFWDTMYVCRIAALEKLRRAAR